MKKVVKNDKGEIVPEKCDKCGGKVVLQIHGEPVYVCKECGKYFGTMPCNIKENKSMKISEARLRKVISESINKVLSEKIIKWNDEEVNTYHIGAMIKSDMNPMTGDFEAKSIEEAIEKATEYFMRYSPMGDKQDVDIFYVKHDNYQGI